MLNEFKVVVDLWLDLVNKHVQCCHNYTVLHFPDSAAIRRYFGQGMLVTVVAVQ